MDGNTYTKDEKCPICGKLIEFGKVPMINREFRISCDCEKNKHKDEEITNGKERIYHSKFVESGLKQRQREKSFDNFIPSEGQLEAFEKCKKLVENYSNGGEYSGLMVCGGVGTGKTHLAAAVARAIIELDVISDSDARMASKLTYHCTYTPVKFVTTIELLEQLRSCFNGGNSASVMENYKTPKLLVLDDFGAEKATEWVLERLFEIIDYRYNEYLPIMITTNLSANEIKERFGGRISDRLREMCLLVNINAGSQRVTAYS